MIAKIKEITDAADFVLNAESIAKIFNIILEEIFAFILKTEYPAE